MKKFVLFAVLTIASAFQSAALGTTADRHHHHMHTGRTAPQILIACYSQTGNTRHVAHQIKKAVGGVLMNIVPVNAYPADLKECVAKVRKENSEKIKPELKKLPDFSRYDIIFIGTPNWCGTMAPPVASFIANAKLQGKKVILFVTHGKGGLQNCEKDFKAMLPGVAIGKTGAFPGKDVKKLHKEIHSWARAALLE